MSTLTPGPTGSPVAPEAWVLRVGQVVVNEVATSSAHAPPNMFELTSDDKKSPVPRLSVFAEELTIADQAWAILGCQPKHTVVACAQVERINSLSNAAGIRTEVQWDRVLDSDAPGIDGHCGIANLNQGDKRQRRELRSQLADQFRLSKVPVPHNFSEKELQVAAFYIYERDVDSNSPESHWVSAIRNMRRKKSGSLQLGDSQNG